MGAKSRIFLWAAGVTVTSSVLAGVVAIALQHGFGVADLYSFAFWSAPFALVTGAIASLVERVTRRLSLALKYLACMALGLVSGFLWTVVVATLLGPWFGAFSLPVLACWVVGAICGLASSLTASSIRQLKFKVLESLVLCAIAATGAAAYGPLITWLRHDQALTVICVRLAASI